eukprot:m.453570 g.453570  ORF g.453570 m.453570 type:complete len:376 (-) comp21551_c0_seq1:420-1547(-)
MSVANQGATSTRESLREAEAHEKIVQTIQDEEQAAKDGGYVLSESAKSAIRTRLQQQYDTAWRIEDAKLARSFSSVSTNKPSPVMSRQEYEMRQRMAQIQRFSEAEAHRYFATGKVPKKTVSVKKNMFAGFKAAWKELELLTPTDARNEASAPQSAAESNNTRGKHNASSDTITNSQIEREKHTPGVIGKGSMAEGNDSDLRDVSAAGCIPPSPSVLSDPLWTMLGSCCPGSIQVRQRQLLYTAVGTEPHSSLEDLYSRCERAHPTMLVIQTDDHRVFGAYCSHPWCGAVGLGSTTRAMVLCGCGNLVKDICVLVCFRPIGGSSVSSHWCCGAVCYALHCRTHVQMRSVGHSGTAMVGSTLAMRHALCGTHAMGA